MKILHTISELQGELNVCRSAGKSIALVPTMGALHRGHVSLVERAVAENDITVVSIFVNPTQFNDKNDLKNYPRTLEADCALLESVGATFAFAPEVQEMYPEPDTRQFSFSPLDEVMEGACRPGHFNGVAQIVSKLFYAVEPDRAYFGEKDFQQLAIIRAMVRQLNFNLEIIGCPIVREDDGLAMSSRNTLLTPDERVRAVNISRILKQSYEYAKEHTLQETKQFVENNITAVDGFILEYFQIVDGHSLQQIESWADSNYAVG
ncbi:MAG: pantoate--beta-alanine ligase, partial [Bacteroidaceae bacterium]|nr:pantoate--beta-alanine ligase [Bacteroidaceae bacterium]